MNRYFAWIVLALVCLLAGCAAPEAVKPAPEAARPEPEPAIEAPVMPVTPSRPMLTGPAARAEVQKILRQAFDWLDAGEEDKAKSELQYAHQLEPDNKQVGCLLRGISADPVEALGRESTTYTVRPGESLGRIAQRAMGDVCEFYILARYNQIKVPKQLGAGQTIRIPGKVALAPPQEAVPVTKPEPKPESPPVVVEPVKPKPAEPDEKAKRAMVDRYHRSAQAAYRRQDLTTAIRDWDKVLEIDPNNDLAKARKQEALDLQRRLNELKK